jgi:Flp pilus assembly protein TadG
MKIISDESRQALVDVPMTCRSAGSPVVSVKTRSICELVRAHLCTNNEGGALVEFAVVLPILLLTLMGIFTFGIAMNNYSELTESVNNGARVLAINRGQTTDPCALTVAAIYAAAPTLAQTKFVFTFVLDGTTYTGTSCSSSSTTTGAAAYLVQGKSAEVTATYPCNLTVYGVNYAPGCTLRAQTTEIVQ